LLNTLFVFCAFLTSAPHHNQLHSTRSDRWPYISGWIGVFERDLVLPAPAFWKNYLFRIALGATVDSSQYERLYPRILKSWQLRGFELAGIKSF
jgi:hypothetical protein